MQYNAKKGAQVVAYFASKNENKRIEVIKVVKLVYLADRESIRRFGFPILNEDRYSMRLGPVNSMTYSHIKGEYDLEKCGWAEYLQDRENHEVSAVKRDGEEEDCWDELSDAEIECLDSVWEKFGKMGKWDLVNWMHDSRNIPEWEDPNGGSVLIPLERIMRNVGIENTEELAEEVRSFGQIDKTLASLR